MKANKVSFYDAKGDAGNHTELWRVFSWCLGDKHADRLCYMVHLYCRATGVKPERLYRWPYRE